MRVIKLAIISFIILFLLVTGFSLLIPGNVKISKATNIAATDTGIFFYVQNLKEWKQWHPAFKEIQEADFEVINNETIKVKGTTIVVKERNSDELLTEISGNGSRPILNSIKILRHQQGDSSTLQWYMGFQLKWYPWEKFKTLFYENFYGVQMEQGLQNLKELSELRRSSTK